MGKIINRIRERRNKPIEVEAPELYTTDAKGRKLPQEGSAEVIKDTQTETIPEQSTLQEVYQEQPTTKTQLPSNKANPFAKITDEEVASLAKNMEGGLTYENIQRAYNLVKTGGNIDTSLPEPKAELPKAKTLEETISSPVVTPEIKVPAPQAEEAESKTYPEDWLMTYKKSNPKPNVLKDLGLAGYEKYDVPDDLLNYFGKDLKTAIDQIKDENGNPLTEEEKKKILRRIRGVRVGDALMKIANITGQAVGVGMGGAPVAMDNVPILQRIGANAQAKQDAWIKQSLEAKEADDKKKYDEAKLNMDLWDRETKAQYNTEKLALEKLKAQNKINETQYNMLLNAKKLEAAIKNNNRRNAIAQQRADAYEKDRTASNAIMKNNRHYYLNGVPYVVPSSQLNKMAGSLISELADKKNKNIVDGSPMLQEYLKKENIEAIKKDANKAEQFLGYITTTHPEIALPIISQNRVSNDIERAYMSGYFQSPIAPTPIETEDAKIETKDDLLQED